MSDVNLLPTTPDPAYVSIIAGLIRGIMALASGVGFTIGTYSDSQITMAATAAVGLATLLWSAWSKLKAAKRNRDSSIESATRSAVASAEAGKPIAIAVTSDAVARLP